MKKSEDGEENSHRLRLYQKKPVSSSLEVKLFKRRYELPSSSIDLLKILDRKLHRVELRRPLLFRLNGERF